LPKEGKRGKAAMKRDLTNQAPEARYELAQRVSAGKESEKRWNPGGVTPISEIAGIAARSPDQRAKSQKLIAKSQRIAARSEELLSTVR
jgi:hypothetical protein